MDDQRAVAAMTLIFAVVVFFMLAAFVHDLRERTGHLETDVRALESQAARHQPKPSCKVNGRTVICHLPKAS